MTTLTNVIYLRLHKDVDDKIQGLLNNMKHLKLVASGGPNVILEISDSSKDVTIKKLSGSKLIKKAMFLKRFNIA